MTIEIKYTSGIEKAVIRLLGADEKFALDIQLKANPKEGAVIPKTGGARKLRFPIRKKKIGKRSGVRVIHYFWNNDDQLFVFDVYSHDEKSDISEDDKKAIKKFIEGLEAEKDEE